MDGDFPWILAGALLLWLFNLVGGRKRGKIERPQPPRDRRPPPVDRRPEPMLPGLDPTQSEGGRLEELLRALEQRLDPTAAEPAPPRPRPTQPARGPLGRPAKVPLPAAEELEERQSLEVDPVVETLEREIRRPERINPDRLAQAEAKERTRLLEAEARDAESHRSRHAGFDKRIRTPPPLAEPAERTARRLTTAQMRQAFIWGEILSRPKGDW